MTAASEMVNRIEDTLNSLGTSLVGQLDPPNSDDWVKLSLVVSREERDGHEGHRASLEVTRPCGTFPLIPRPQAWEALLELDRIGRLSEGPRWSGLRLALSREAGEITYECSWQYDEG